MKEKFLENKHLLDRFRIGLVLIILLLGSIQAVSAADTIIATIAAPTNLRIIDDSYYEVYIPPLTADITATPININRDLIRYTPQLCCDWDKPSINFNRKYIY